MNGIIDATNIDVSLTSYSEPKSHQGGKVINMYNKETKEPFTLAMPLMSAWGAQEGKDQNGNPTGKFSMSLIFQTGQYATPESIEAHRQMLKLLEKIKQDAMANSLKWFGKEIKSMDVIDEKFMPMLKYPKIKGSNQLNYDAAPTMPIKLPCWKDVWQTSVFDEDQNMLYVKGKTEPGITPLNFLTSDSKAPFQVVSLIQCGGLWFVANTIAITWNLKQVIVRKPRQPSIMDDVCFLNVRPSEREALKALPETEPVIEALTEVVSGTVVEESDDEADYQLPPPQVAVSAPVPAPVSDPVSAPAPVPPEPVAEEAPATAPAKKTVVKKVAAKKTA